MASNLQNASNLECDYQEKPKGTLPHFSLLLPVAVELPHEYLWTFLENHIPHLSQLQLATFFLTNKWQPNIFEE